MPVAHDTDIANILAFVDFQVLGLLYPASYRSQPGYRHGYVFSIALVELGSDNVAAG
jgi:hypothetical protein